MDDIEQQERNDLDSYVTALEDKISELAEALDDIQAEKEMLFNDYISSLAKLFDIGGK